MKFNVVANEECFKEIYGPITRKAVTLRIIFILALLTFAHGFIIYFCAPYAKPGVAFNYLVVGIGIAGLLFLDVSSVLSIIKMTRGWKKAVMEQSIERIKTTYHEDHYEFAYEMGETSFIPLDSAAQKEYFFSDIESWYETEHYVAVILKGKLTFTIDKASIENGSVETLESVLSKFGKGKKYKK